jgi:hypothetical protein
VILVFTSIESNAYDSVELKPEIKIIYMGHLESRYVDWYFLNLSDEINLLFYDEVEGLKLFEWAQFRKRKIKKIFWNPQSEEMIINTCQENVNDITTTQ